MDVAVTSPFLPVSSRPSSSPSFHCRSSFILPFIRHHRHIATATATATASATATATATATAIATQPQLVAISGALYAAALVGFTDWYPGRGPRRVVRLNQPSEVAISYHFVGVPWQRWQPGSLIWRRPGGSYGVYLPIWTGGGGGDDGGGRVFWRPRSID